MSDFRDRAINKEDTIDPEILRKAEYRMGTTKARLLLQQPFYGVLLSMTDFTPEAVIPTMATDGVRVYYNPNFVMGLSDDEVYGVLLHEISHCIYLHCTQKRRLNRDSKRWNVACDYAINLEITDMGYKLPKDVLLDEKYRNLNAEQIFDALPANIANLETLDTHIESDDEDNWDDMEDKIMTAYEMTKNSKTKGDLPGGIKRWIDKMRKAKVKWERVFHRYVGQALAKDDYSYVRVNKRMIGQEIYLPDLRSYIIGNVVVGIDTSGSIGANCLKQFAAELQKISHLVSEVTVMSCDAQVHEVVKVTKFSNFLNKVQFRGGGGTDFRPVFDKVKELNITPELLVYLTDTYGSFPDKQPGYPVLWCITEENGKVPWGHAVYIPGDKKDY